MKKIFALLMLATMLFSIGCGNTSAGTGGNNVTKADFDRFAAEMRDEFDALGVRVAELEKSGKSGGVSKSTGNNVTKADLDRLAAEFRDELDALGVRVAELEKK